MCVTIRLNNNCTSSLYRIDTDKMILSIDDNILSPKKNVYLVYFIASIVKKSRKIAQVYGIRYLEMVTGYDPINRRPIRMMSLGVPNPGIKSSTVLNRVFLPNKIVDEIRLIDRDCDIVIKKKRTIV